MSLTVTEADAINVVLRHALDLPDDAGVRSKEGEAQAAAALLADHAHKRMGAGLRGVDVMRAWPDPADEPSDVCTCAHPECGAC